MKYRAKFNTPWCKRGEIFKLDNYPEQEKSICYEYKSRAILFDPMAYPDLFEPVEEKTNKEKWIEVLMGYYPYTEKGKDRDFKTLSANLVLLGYNPDKIYKEVCGEG